MLSAFSLRPAAGALALLAVAAQQTGQAQSPSSQTAPGQAQTAFERGWQNGTPATITGTLTAIFADDFERGRSELMHFVRDTRTGRTFRLRYQGATPPWTTGATVTLFGRAMDSELFVLATQTTDSGASSSSPTLALPSSPLGGDQHTLVSLVNFSDLPLSCSYADVENAMFSDPAGMSVDNLYRSTSLGRIGFSGAVTGPVTINAKSTDTCDIGAWADAANALFEAAGGDLSTYHRRVYVMPPNACPAAGYGSVGGNPSYAWVFRCDLKGVFAHELGHNLGLDHAATPTSEYGDTTDPMAFSTRALRGANAPHRHQMGWFDPASTRILTASGTYDIAPLATPPAEAPAAQMLVISKADTREYYYLSYRQAVGFDSNIDSTYLDRLSIHRYAGDGSASRTYLLAALRDGEAFTDSVNGVSVRLLSHSAGLATVAVDLVPVCTSGPPSMNLTPSSQSALAGTSLTYEFSVTSTDSAGCSAATFDLAVTVPEGWGSSMSSASVTLSPGATAQGTLTLTSAQAAAAGVYAATISASEQGGAHSASATATYSVTAPCIRSAPLITGSPLSQSAAPGAAVGYTIRVSSTDSAPCAPQEVRVETGLPIGWSASPSLTTLGLAPGASSTLVVTVSSPAQATPGTYVVNLRAVPQDAAAIAGMTTASYVVEQWDTQPPTSPSGLSASVSQKQKRVTLSWTVSSDNDIVAGYQIFRNGVRVATAMGTSWIDQEWVNGATYTYYVVAQDANFNLSNPSQTVTVTLGGGSSGGNGGGKNR